MKAKTKFLKMFYKLPEISRSLLVYDPYGLKPTTLEVCSLEVRADTKLGKKILFDLGYVDT